MKNNELIKKVKELAKSATEKYGLELFDVKYYNQSGKWILEIIIDNPFDYVSTTDCEKVSREIEATLDMLDIIPKRYFLTVSSPGLDRPLRNINDFIRFQNKKAKIITKTKTIIGQILNVENNVIYILLENGNTERINYSEIEKANLEIEF
ncbi:ribosome maturation factor RimP [Thermosipho atlanticus]|uniref:Ribosome maturation factor RimP n=1 Tax=Thermosipho atlanticus DSM 15807 TaxID=1123380 RepID=A0A1M5QZY6_9BACT|nr:ribosome maturation factor [Thermosipho atlanticus]SHH19704.1 ribosome maturation factor RimP [Thermosipho atlanticus DSM 15807]